MKVGDYITLKNHFNIAYGRIIEGEFSLIATPELEQLKGKRVKVVRFDLWTCNPIVEFNGKQFEVDITWVER